jgi:poly(hydroxyalkanoate) granule-associated protein
VLWDFTIRIRSKHPQTPATLMQRMSGLSTSVWEILMATKKRARRARAAAKGKTSPMTVRENVIETGHNIWLAGLGALSRTQTEGPKLFQELVTEGSKFDQRARTTAKHLMDNALKQVRGAVDTGVESVRDKTSETWENIEQIFQSRVQRALQQLGVPTADEIHMLSRKVDELTRSVRSIGNGKRESRSSPQRRGRANAEHVGGGAAV